MSAILSEDPPELSETSRNISSRPRTHRAALSGEESGGAIPLRPDLAFDLQALSADSSAASRPAAAAGRVRQRRMVPLAWAAAALAAGVILAGLGAAALLRRSGAEPPTFRRLTFRRGYVSTARFAPDGQTIVYGAAWEGKPVEIYTARPESPESRPFGIGPADVLSISKAGELALSPNRRFTTGWETVGTLAQMPLSGGAPREILENVSEADWAPDGKSLAVVHEVSGKYRRNSRSARSSTKRRDGSASPAFPRGATGSPSSITRFAETTPARSRSWIWPVSGRSFASRPARDWPGWCWATRSG